MKTEYFLFGSYISTAYTMEGVDGAIEAIKGGFDYSLLAYSPDEMTGEELLSQFEGFDRFILLDELDYDVLCRTSVELLH